MNIYEKIMYIYPNLSIEDFSNGNIVIEQNMDENNNPSFFVSKWNKELPLPILDSYDWDYIENKNKANIIEKENIKSIIENNKQYLILTDHKFFNGYKPKPDEDLGTIEAKRDKAREFIRANEGVSNGL